MSVALYMDEHVHSAITIGLRLRGVDVLTAQEDGQDGEPDPVILDRALSLGRLLFTNDQDFLIEGARRLQAGEPFAGIAFARQHDIQIGVWIDDLVIIAKAHDEIDVANAIFYIPI